MMNNEAIRSFLGLRFGMFIHWGVYSRLGGELDGKTVGNELGEWIMGRLHIPIGEYEKIAAEFNPVDFDADEWVRLAYEAGMRYIVITAKHGDGFSMYRSGCDKYNIADWTRFRRDAIAELAAACKKRGIKLGFYYSQDIDLHEEHAGGWDIDPYYDARFDETITKVNNYWDFPNDENKDYNIYFEKKVKPQVTELLTQYGEVELMWFDNPGKMTVAQSEELYKLVKSLQPDCLVNSRIGNNKGDYVDLGDNQIPAVRMPGPTETVVTLNETWGYKSFDHNWKTKEEMVEMLMKNASRNANLLLNVGPMGNGKFTPETLDILKGIAEWMSMNGEAIHETIGNPAPSDFGWGYVTVNKNKLFLCMKENTEQTVELNGLCSRVLRAYSLAGHDAITFVQKIDRENDVLSLKLVMPSTGLIFPVYALECADTPVFDSKIMQQGDSLILYPLTAKLFDGTLKDGISVLMVDNFYTYEYFSRMKLDCGILTGWSRSGDYVEWEAVFTSAASYRAELIVSEIPKSECRVIIEVSGANPIKSGLREDFVSSDSRTCHTVNMRIGTVCGSVSVEEPGLHKIRLRLNRDMDEESKGIPLVALRFVRSGKQ